MQTHHIVKRHFPMEDPLFIDVSITTVGQVTWRAQSAWLREAFIESGALCNNGLSTGVSMSGNRTHTL